MFQLASSETNTLTTRKHKEAAIHLYNRIFKNHLHMTEAINLGQYHDRYSPAVGDIRLDYYIKPYNYYNYASESGQQFLVHTYRLLYVIYLAYGLDMPDPENLIRYRKDCDYLYILHNRTYTYNRRAYTALTLDIVHSLIESVITDAQSKSNKEIYNEYYANIKQKYADKITKRITYLDRKRQLTCSRQNMLDFAPDFLHYLTVLYNTADIPYKKSQTEKRSYQRYRRKFDIKSSEHQGRPRKYDITFDPALSLIDQADAIMSNTEYQEGTYQYTDERKRIYNILYSQKRNASKKINNLTTLWK
jgi:hypothetical protein